MIAAITQLLLCQLAGEIVVRALALPLPGPVAGLGLMVGILAWRGRHGAPAVSPELGRVADGLLANLSLLFIPAAVGVVQYLDLLRRFAVPIGAVIAVSTVAALAVTAVSFRLASKRTESRNGPDRGDTTADAGGTS